MACFVISLTPQPHFLHTGKTYGLWRPYLRFPKDYGITGCNTRAGFYRLQMLEPFWQRERQA
jgi:hypothetical protein